MTDKDTYPTVSPEEEQQMLKTKINTETAKVSWVELQPHYARGSVMWLSEEMDLVQVALRLCEDDKTSFQQWLDTGAVSLVNDEQAKRWFESSEDLWCTVVAPWVLVQEVK
ncbi:MAG: DUF2288 domain-containing protein [Cellvibrionaceae bacterium]